MSLYKKGEVLVLNVENKTLPFPTQDLFQDVSVTSYGDATKVHDFLYYFNSFLMAQKGLLKNQSQDDVTSSGELVDYNKVKLMVVDSISQVFELMLAYHKKSYTGKDLRQVYGLFQDEVKSFWTKSNAFPIPKVFLALPQELQDELGIVERKAYIPGQALAGKVEKEFVISFACTPDRYAKKSVERFRFQTSTLNGYVAKTPMQMFDEEKELFVPNDLNFVIERIYKHYKKTPESNFRFPDILVVGNSGTGKSSSMYKLVTEE